MSNWNTLPDNLLEISLQDWQNGLFMYQLAEPEMRQIREKGSDEAFDLRLFPLKYEPNKGFAVKNTFWSNGKSHEPKITFCVYGEGWEKFKQKIAAQFAGDNT